MSPAADVGIAIITCAVPNRHFGNFQIELGRTEQKIEIAKWIKIPEILAIFHDQVIVATPEHFSPAERVLDRLPQEPGKGQAEEFVAEDVQKPHGPVLQWVDKADTVDEFALAGHDSPVESG